MLWQSSEETGHEHRVPARIKHLAAQAALADALWDIAVMVTGEATKRAICG
jgi:hypothetical protein